MFAMMCSPVLYAQSYDSIISDIEQKNAELQEQLTKLEQRTQELTIQVAGNSERVALLGEAIEQKVGGLHEQMDSIDERYGLRMSDAETAVQETGTRQQKSVVWGAIIAVVICFLLTMAYLILRKRISKKGDDIELLRARADELNRQIADRMGKELEELQKASEAFVAAKKSLPAEAEPDHKVVLAVGDNLAIMETNLSRMDNSTRGYTNLQRSIERIKANLMSLGYEIVEMLGKDYVEGSTVDKVAFRDDESLEEGKQIITAVRKPQINYNGKAIQFANIEVSQNI